MQTRVSPGPTLQGRSPGARPEPKVKSFEIGKRLVYQAWEKVRADNGAPGVDAVGIGLFAEQLRDNLYKEWNRMSSGSYFPGSGAGRGDYERIDRRRRVFIGTSRIGRDLREVDGHGESAGPATVVAGPR